MINTKINSIRFNQDFSCFVCATNEGLRIFNVEPLVELSHIEYVGSISKAEMLYRINAVAIISDGNSTGSIKGFPYIYDLNKHTTHSIYSGVVLNILLRRDKIVVVEQLRTKMYAEPYKQKPVMILDLVTGNNPKGLCELSPLSTSERSIMVTPGNDIGSIQISKLGLDAAQSSPPTIIKAHQNELECIALNQNATMVATASERGTQLRVFDTLTGNNIAELRRGSDGAKIYCINFSHDDLFICCCSNKGTVHIFSLTRQHSNRMSNILNITPVCSYTNSRWALAKFSVPTDRPFVCAFGPPANAGGSGGVIYVACVDGSFYKYTFKVDGKCSLSEFDKLLEMCTHRYPEL